MSIELEKHSSIQGKLKWEPSHYWASEINSGYWKETGKRQDTLSIRQKNGKTYQMNKAWKCSLYESSEVSTLSELRACWKSWSCKQINGLLLFGFSHVHGNKNCIKNYLTSPSISIPRGTKGRALSLPERAHHGGGIWNITQPVNLFPSSLRCWIAGEKRESQIFMALREVFHFSEYFSGEEVSSSGLLWR